MGRGLTGGGNAPSWFPDTWLQDSWLKTPSILELRHFSESQNCLLSWLPGSPLTLQVSCRGEYICRIRIYTLIDGAFYKWLNKGWAEHSRVLGKEALFGDQKTSLQMLALLLTT